MQEFLGRRAGGIVQTTGEEFVGSFGASIDLWNIQFTSIIVFLNCPSVPVLRKSDVGMFATAVMLGLARGHRAFYNGGARRGNMKSHKKAHQVCRIALDPLELKDLFERKKLKS